MGPGQDQTRDHWLAITGSAVRLASVARHVTDCSMRPKHICMYAIIEFVQVNKQTEHQL